MHTFVALDFETADHKPDSACAIGVVQVIDYQIAQRFYTLIRPPRQRFRFTHIHGICWRDVAGQPTFGELWPRVSSVFEEADFIAAHNAAFDKGVLHESCRAYGVMPPTHDFTCTVKLARRTWNSYPTKLSDVCRFLDIPLNHHHALSDAEACAQIVIAANQMKAR